MRPLSATAIAALSGPSPVIRWIVRVTLPGPVVWGASDGPDYFTWDNGEGPVTYYPLDASLRVTVPGVQASLQNQGAVIQLSATDPNLLAQLMNEPYRAAPVEVAVLLFENGVPAEEFVKFDGPGDQIGIEDQPLKAPTASGHDDEAPQVSTLTFKVAPRTVDLKRGNGRWATNVDQQFYRDPADTFFQDVALVGVSTLNWGQTGNSSPAGSATSGASGVSVAGIPGSLAGVVANLAGRFAPGFSY